MNNTDTKAAEPRRSALCHVTWVISALAFTTPARAVDEIQVYNAGILAPGQLTIQQHLNYVALVPPFS